MKKFLAFIVPVIIGIALFSVSSCSTKFKIAAPYKNITVVWGLLDQSDTAHYIRIEKAFLSNTLSSVTMAQVADSNYSPGLNVKIERINSFGNVFDTIHLNLVDLDKEGYPKQPGVFFTAPNYAYKFTNLLDPTYTYRLIITNFITGEVDSAETPVIVDNSNTVFNVPDIDDSLQNRAGLDFHSVLISIQNVVIFSGSYVTPQGYSFYGQTSPVSIAEFVVGFNWVDSNILTGAKAYNSGNYDLGFQGLTNGTFNYNVNNVDMYSAVRATLGVAPTNTIRYLNYCNLTAYLATPDYSTYQQLQSNAGTGLTGGEIEPIYTNVKGANVLGLFTSKGTRAGTIGIDYTTIDSMIVNPITSTTGLKGADLNGVLTSY